MRVRELVGALLLVGLLVAPVQAHRSDRASGVWYHRPSSGAGGWLRVCQKGAGAYLLDADQEGRYWAGQLGAPARTRLPVWRPNNRPGRPVVGDPVLEFGPNRIRFCRVDSGR